MKIENLDNILFEINGWSVVELSRDIESATAVAEEAERTYSEVHRLYDDDDHWVYSPTKGLGEYLAALAVKIRDDAVPYSEVEEAILGCRL